VGLQAATTSGRPVVLRVQAHGGHSLGSARDQESALLAGELAFCLHAFGLDDPDRGWPSDAAGWLPEPDGPTMAASSLWSMVRLTPGNVCAGGSPG
jgi:Protease II